MIEQLHNTLFELHSEKIQSENPARVTATAIDDLAQPVRTVNAKVLEVEPTRLWQLLWRLVGRERQGVFFIASQRLPASRLAIAKIERQKTEIHNARYQQASGDPLLVSPWPTRVIARIDSVLHPDIKDQTLRRVSALRPNRVYLMQNLDSGMLSAENARAVRLSEESLQPVLTFLRRPDVDIAQWNTQTDVTSLLRWR